MMLCSLMCVFKIPMVLGSLGKCPSVVHLYPNFFPKHIIFALELRDYSTLEGFYYR